MSEQQIHQPGRYEAEALVMMNEVERPTARPRQYVVVHQETPGAFRAYAWNDKAGRWGHAGLGDWVTRARAIDFLLPLVHFDNVTITDEHIEFAEFDGFGPDEFDDCAFHPKHGRLMYCPEGVPGLPNEWNGVGLSTAATERYLVSIHRFPKVSLPERFREAAAVPAAMLSYQPKGATVLVRHDVAARDLVSRERWGITDRPDLIGRQVDEEFRRRQEAEEETQRLIAQPGGFSALRRQQEVDRQKAIDRASKR